MTSEEIIEVEVMFDFEVIDFFEFAEKTNKEVFDRLMIDFGKSKFNWHLTDEEISRLQKNHYPTVSEHMDYWIWFEFFKREQPDGFYPIWELFVESEYPHSHRLVEPTSKKMEE